jgi:hypothetical protein
MGLPIEAAPPLRARVSEQVTVAPPPPLLLELLLELLELELPEVLPPELLPPEPEPPESPDCMLKP